LTPLESATSVVTGASSGIGRAIATTLGSAGSHVFITGRDGHRLEETAAPIRAAGGTATIAGFDLTDTERLQSFVAQAAESTGRLDVLVNAAGVDIPGTIADADPQQWREMFDTNVIALLAASQAAVKAMRATSTAGHIVNISSGAGRAEVGRVYGATKAAVNSIAGTLRSEVEEDGIRVVNVLPGAIATNFGRNFPAEFIAQLLASVGLHADFSTGDVLPESILQDLNTRAGAMFGSPDDIAQAVLYAVSVPADVSVSELAVGPRKPFPVEI
jgi:NADP-dependent 3-hydroxy acid dehydrogenase YdfG